MNRENFFKKFGFKNILALISVITVYSLLEVSVCPSFSIKLLVDPEFISSIEIEFIKFFDNVPIDLKILYFLHF